jgi:diguanylate cyclase (GGDEF)-like protein
MIPRILVIDDSPDIHELVDIVFTGQSYDVLHALDATGCCALVHDKQPDLVLLDLNMPGLSGFDACVQLKADPRTEYVPVIFLTGERDTQRKVEGFELGAVDYISKPFNKAELLARVRSVLRTKQQRDRLAEQALTDSLTGLGNRAAFDQRLSETVASALRYQRPASLVMIDLDHFKQLNDTYGHPFGDCVLRSVGRVLAETGRDTDIACRYGGEEFAILLTETRLGPAVMVAERVRSAIAELRLPFGPELVQVTASLGVAATEEIERQSRLSAEALVASADEALYRAKGGGRNRVAAAGSPPSGAISWRLNPVLGDQLPSANA